MAQCPGGGEGPAEFGAGDSEPSPDPQSSSPPTSHVHVLQHVLQHVHSHSVYLSLQQTVGQLRVVQKQLSGLLRVLLNAPLHLLHQLKHLLWGEAGHGLCDGLGGRFWGDRGPVQGGLCACVCVYQLEVHCLSHTASVPTSMRARDPPAEPPPERERDDVIVVSYDVIIHHASRERETESGLTSSLELPSRSVSGTVDPEWPTVDLLPRQVPHSTHGCLPILILTEPEAPRPPCAWVVDQPARHSQYM